MVSTPTLTSSGMNTGFTLKTDTSNGEIGVVLMQETNEIKFPIAYASKKLLPRETRYSVIERVFGTCLGYKEIPHVPLWQGIPGRN